MQHFQSSCKRKVRPAHLAHKGMAQANALPPTIPAGIVLAPATIPGQQGALPAKLSATSVTSLDISTTAA